MADNVYKLYRVNTELNDGISYDKISFIERSGGYFDIIKRGKFLFRSVSVEVARTQYRFHRSLNWKVQK